MSRRKRLAPLLGVALRLEDGCLACGSDIAKIAPGRGMHLVDLRCAVCNINRGHLSRVALSSIADLVADHGRPTTPINLRRERA